MQFITRVLIVLGVLAGLGYGSYAFGKYVLSARLFGPQAKNSATAKGTLQSPSNVDVEVVPAPQPKIDSDNSSDATPTSEPRPTPDERSESTPSTDNSDYNSDSSASNNSNSGDTPRKKPKRRKRRKPRATEPTKKRETTTTPAVQAPPARDQNVDPPSNSDSGNDVPQIPVPRNDAPRNDAPRVDTPRNDNPVPSPTRRERERRTVPKVEPRTDVMPPRRRESSPVPVPEGALGGRGESPVPAPG